MERMQIKLISLREPRGLLTIRAKVEAHSARLWIEAYFKLGDKNDIPGCRREAYDEILLYLDIS